MTEPEVFLPGLQVVLQPSYSATTRLTAFIRGCKEQEYLILEPPNKQALKFFPEETACIVRFIREGKAIGFQTHVLGVIRSPFPLIFLSFPDGIESAKLRNSVRYPVKIETVCAPKKLAGALEGHPRATMLNISSGGCLIEALEEFERKTTLYLSFELPNQGRINDLPAEIRSCEKQSDKFLHGLAFSEGSSENYRKVTQYLNSLAALRIRI